MATELRKRSFGRTDLDAERLTALHKARRLEGISLMVSVVSMLIVLAVMGNSQVMKAVWIEDMLGLLPALVFLWAVRLAVRPP